MATAGCSSPGVPEDTPEPTSFKGGEDRETLQAPEILNVLTYNVFLRGPSFFFRDGQDQRVRFLPGQLLEYDVIILQETFSDRHRQRLLRELEPSYPYRTRVLGRDGFLKQDGGVVVVSRWPIEFEDQSLFGRICAGFDCFASKGVVYARINKEGSVYHVFGAHAQDGERHRAIRERQFGIIKEFITSLCIPVNEPVIIGGDLNVNLFGDRTDGAYTAMRELLDATHPEPKSGSDYVPTWDGINNSLNEGHTREYLDYVLYSNAHLLPQSSFSEVRIFRVDGQDLSDHYAVYGRFVFGERATLWR